MDSQSISEGNIIINNAIIDVIQKADFLNVKINALKLSHYYQSHRAKTRNQIMGIIATTISAIVGTTIFISLSKTSKNNDDGTYIKFITGFLSVFAAVVTALQTFLNFPDTASKHKAAASDFESISNKIEIYLLNYRPFSYESNSTIRKNAIDDLAKITELFEKASSTAPIVPDAIYNKYKDTRPLIHETTPTP